MKVISILSQSEADAQELDSLYGHIRIIAKRNGVDSSVVHSAIDGLKLSILKQPLKQYQYD